MENFAEWLAYVITGFAAAIVLWLVGATILIWGPTVIGTGFVFLMGGLDLIMFGRK